MKKYLIYLLILSSCISLSCKNNIIKKEYTPAFTKYSVDNTISDDSAMESLIAPYRDDLKKRVGIVIGYSDTILTGARPEGALGNFVCDVIKDYADRNAGGADICLMNNGGLRRDIPLGEITIGTIYELMPFDNELVICFMDDKIVREFADELIKVFGEPVAGIQVLSENNIIKVIKVAGKDLEDGKLYRIATSDYLAYYGGDFPSLRKSKEIKRTGKFIRDILIEYFKDSGKVYSIIEGRIVIK
ncbi:MAG: 5'-nucleotidase C-terminal domain-containing protein [Candidatus Hydrogenedentota bacterium]